MIAEVTLSLSDFGAMGAILAVFMVPILAMLRGSNQRVVTIEARIKEVEDGKADKKECLRGTFATKAAIDRVALQLAEMKGRIDASIGLQGAAKRMAEAVEKVVEGMTHESK